MEFRIAPFIVLTLGILIQLLSLPEIGDSARILDNGPKMIAIGAVILFLALGSFFRHHFYPKSSQILYYSMLALYLALYIKYIYQYINY